MAAINTESIPTSQTNGVIEDGYEEDEKMKMRPADIDADMREMERRKRVELIMNSRLFREELERIIESQIKDGNSSAGLLQQISDMVGSKYGTNNHILRNSSCVVPINDIRGIEAMGYAKGEKILRCKLAALFRLIDLYGWSQNIYNHVTARLNQQEEHFLVNPYGLLNNEITASSLVKVDMQGNVIETGTTNFSVNAGGFQLHAAIYAARPDLKCIVHLHTPSVLAISSLKEGLLPLCQEAAVIGDVSQHAYIGIPNEPEERNKLARNLGPNNKVIFLTNHGALCCGETIEETFFNACNTVSACETQLKIMPFGKDSLLLLSDETRKSMYDASRKVPENVLPPLSNVPSAATIADKRWRIGGLEFEALMRMLDNAGFRTGYVYRQPLIKGELPRPRNDVEVPPAVSSLGYLLEEEELYKQGVWRKQFGTKGNDRIRWLNSPNVYQKVEILETGTSDPKKITKWVDANNEEWVAEGSPSHTSTPVKIENALQFVPKNTNPKEFKKLQQKLKENRRADKITSGPQSHILEGVSWEEAKKLQDANMSGTNDQIILVGAASKGIIQREFQHNATVYKTPYAKNPFDAVTDEELENYKKDITRKQRGDSYLDEDESDALSSSLPPSGKNTVGVTSETEDDSLMHEMRVIRIETSTAPKASQAEVVLSDDYGFRNEDHIFYTRKWEIRKFFPILRTIATIKITIFPEAYPEPKHFYIDFNSDDTIQQTDLNIVVDTYHLREDNISYNKKVCKLIADEVLQRFRNGDLFRKPTRSSFQTYSASVPRFFDLKYYMKPAPRSFDSSEVEYTTVIEVPNHPPRYLESPHDFSSTTTEDEDEIPSSSDCRLKNASSLSSITSCIGFEYEEIKAPQIELSQNEVNELTASFMTVSDDTSLDDVTVIFCPQINISNPAETKDDDDIGSFSDDSRSVGNLSLSSIDSDVGDETVLSDSNTYSCLSNVDFEEEVRDITTEPVTDEQCSTSFIFKDTKFKTELSVIYEEQPNVSLGSTENIEVDKNNVKELTAENGTTEDVHRSLNSENDKSFICDFFLKNDETKQLNEVTTVTTCMSLTPQHIENSTEMKLISERVRVGHEKKNIEPNKHFTISSDIESQNINIPTQNECTYTIKDKPLGKHVVSSTESNHEELKHSHSLIKKSKLSELNDVEIQTAVKHGKTFELEVNKGEISSLFVACETSENEIINVDDVEFDTKDDVFLINENTTDNNLIAPSLKIVSDTNFNVNTVNLETNVNAIVVAEDTRSIENFQNNFSRDRILKNKFGDFYQILFSPRIEYSEFTMYDNHEESLQVLNKSNEIEEIKLEEKCDRVIDMKEMLFVSILSTDRHVLVTDSFVKIDNKSSEPFQTNMDIISLGTDFKCFDLVEKFVQDDRNHQKQNTIQYVNEEVVNGKSENVKKESLFENIEYHMCCISKETTNIPSTYNPPISIEKCLIIFDILLKHILEFRKNITDNVFVDCQLTASSTDLAAETISSVAIVQDGYEQMTASDNSDAYTISDTSLISCIADSTENLTHRIKYILDERSEFSKKLIDDTKTVIMEQEIDDYLRDVNSKNESINNLFKDDDNIECNKVNINIEKYDVNTQSSSKNQSVAKEEVVTNTLENEMTILMTKLDQQIEYEEWYLDALEQVCKLFQDDSYDESVDHWFSANDDSLNSDIHEISIEDRCCNNNMLYEEVEDNGDGKYDYNENEVIAKSAYNCGNLYKELGTDNQGNKEIAECRLQLKLKIEWDDFPILTGMSSSEHSFSENRSFENDSLNNTSKSSVEKSSSSPTIPMPNYQTSNSVQLLEDFKNNYPKFIQYSDFSPKVRFKSKRRIPQTAPCVRTKRVYHRDTNIPKSAQLKRTKPLRSINLSSDGGYFHYSGISSDWSSLVKIGQNSSYRTATKAGSRIPVLTMLSSDEDTAKSNLLNKNLESISFKTSTPKNEEYDTLICPVLSPIMSSLEEFEILESLLETTNRQV